MCFYCYVYVLLLLYVFCVFCFVVLFCAFFYVSKCTVLLPPSVNPIEVNKYIISYISHHISYMYIYIVSVGCSMSVYLQYVTVDSQKDLKCLLVPEISIYIYICVCVCVCV